MNDELKELFSLASRALECQAEIGHKEVFLEPQRIDTEPESQPMPNKEPVAQQPIPQSLQTKSTSNEDKIPRPIPNYGEIPPVSEEASTTVSTTTEFKDLVAHNKAICECTQCSLGTTRTKFVYGIGNPKAKILFIGEAPGKDEDLQGEPFIGRAGKLLDKILAAMGFKREDIYIANILKCRPPNNRDPQPDEMDLCMPYLKEQIRLIRPQFICALGRIAVQGLLDTKEPLGRLRKRWHRFEGIPFIATYHPAALLRFQKYKRDTWEDMQVLMAEYEKLNNGK